MDAITTNGLQRGTEGCQCCGPQLVFKNIVMVGGSILGASDAVINDGWERIISFHSVEANRINF